MVSDSTAGGRRVLALDLGSSSVRALVCDADARPLPGLLARRAIHLRQSDDGAGELDADAYVAALVGCIDHLAASGALHGVGLVATASQWHSVLAVARDGTPVSPVLTWIDTRAQPTRVPDDPESFHQRTGAWVHSLYWTAKVPWLRERVGTSAARFVGLPDYVRGVLLGDDATSLSMASGAGLLDLRGRCWDAEALDLAGLSSDRAELPTLDDTPRTLAPAWRRRWPALQEALWYPAVGDGAASNLGSGCTRPDAVAVTVGTSAALRVVHASDTPPPSPTVWRYRVDADRLVSGIAFSGGGVLHAWAVELLRLDPSAEPRVPPGTSGLLAVPLHAGSRPPGTAPPGSGLVAGLSLDTSADEFLAATMEGVALEVERALIGLEKLFGTSLEVVLGGGAVHASPWWQRAFAATFDRPVRIAEDPEVGARGAAALALGLELPRPVKEVCPDPEAAARMAQVRTRYAELRSLAPD